MFPKCANCITGWGWKWIKDDGSEQQQVLNNKSTVRKSLFLQYLPVLPVGQGESLQGYGYTCVIPVDRLLPFFLSLTWRKLAFSPELLQSKVYH